MIKAEGANITYTHTHARMYTTSTFNFNHKEGTLEMCDGSTNMFKVGSDGSTSVCIASYHGGFKSETKQVDLAQRVSTPGNSTTAEHSPAISREGALSSLQTPTTLHPHLLRLFMVREDGSAREFLKEAEVDVILHKLENEEQVITEPVIGEEALSWYLTGLMYLANNFAV